ncbi:hypothetical protein BASA81_015402 [Batrachochytrium salamandrivorans]|nr:hypothetical protein BASA81_015402 [Batrachochytrium salamandrivorans]
MKFLEPTKGVGMRKLFSRAGYEVVLVERVPHLVHLLRVRGGRVREVQGRGEPAPLDASEETYGPATTGCSGAKPASGCGTETATGRSTSCGAPRRRDWAARGHPT